MDPRPVPLALLVTLAALVAGAPPIRAQDDDAPNASDLEDRERVEDLVRSLNNPVVVRVPGELRDRIDRLLSARHPMARRRLREILADTGASTVVVEEIISSVIVDRGALDLVPEVVERLRIERESALGRAFDDVLLRYADSDLVRRLAALASDEDRSTDYRATAAAVLGRTGHSEALQVLVELWGAADADVRLAASRAFVRIAPFVRTRDDALHLVAEMHEKQLPLAEVLRRRLRAIDAERPSASQPDYQREYIELARVALPHMPLAELLRLYVASPLPELRAASAARLRDIDWEAQSEPTQARRAAGKALLRALRREDVDAVEGEILETLLPLAPALRENVDDEELAALQVRARNAGGAARPVRQAAVRMLGALRDSRPVAVLQDEFDALRDTDWELRNEILGALASSGADISDWLARRVLDESDVRVAREMVLKLGQSMDPSAVGVLVQLLKDRHPDELLRSYVVQALASLWANSGVARARDALIDFGLNDASVAIREVSANGLGNPRTGDRAPILAALESVAARSDEDVKVRVAASRAILDLDAHGALDRLRPLLAVGAIWDVYRNRRTGDLRSSHATVDDVIRDADALWASDDAGLRERSIQLLQAVVDTGSDLWEGRMGRGLIRESLAQHLLDAGRPADACVVAEALVAAAPREGDPRHRWRLLLGRSLRACGASETLIRAERELGALRADATLPAELKGHVLLELGHALLQRDDPTAAREALASVGDAPLSAADAARLRELRAEAAEKSDAERRLVLSLVARIAEQDAQTSLRALGPRAARQLDSALAAEGTTQDAERVRRLVLATAVVARRTFEIPEGATPADVARIVAEARAALAAVRPGGETVDPR